MYALSEHFRRKQSNNAAASKHSILSLFFTLYTNNVPVDTRTAYMLAQGLCAIAGILARFARSVRIFWEFLISQNVTVVSPDKYEMLL